MKAKEMEISPADLAVEHVAVEAYHDMIYSSPSTGRRTGYIMSNNGFFEDKYDRFTERGEKGKPGNTGNDVFVATEVAKVLRSQRVRDLESPDKHLLKQIATLLQDICSEELAKSGEIKFEERGETKYKITAQELENGLTKKGLPQLRSILPRYIGNPAVNSHITGETAIKNAALLALLSGLNPDQSDSIQQYRKLQMKKLIELFGEAVVVDVTYEPNHPQDLEG